MSSKIMSPLKIVEILLAEDNEDDILMLKDAFEEKKLLNLLQVVKNGAEALNYLHKRGQFKGGKTPGLVLLDINMPKKNGFEVLEEIKNDPNLRHLPVVMLTTSEREEDIKKSYSLGACSHIVKPIKSESFTRLIDDFELYWAMIAKIPDSNGEL